MDGDVQRPGLELNILRPGERPTGKGRRARVVPEPAGEDDDAGARRDRVRCGENVGTGSALSMGAESLVERYRYLPGPLRRGRREPRVDREPRPAASRRDF